MAGPSTTTNIDGKMKITVGNSILIGAFIARLLSGLLAAEARVGGLDAEDPSERDAELVGLDDGAHESGQLRRRDAFGELLERVLAALAYAHLAKHERELLGEGAVHVLGHLRDGAVEAEACFDADGEQVERVRQLGPHGLAASARRGLVTSTSGAKKPTTANMSAEQERRRRAAGDPDEAPHEHAPDRSEHP